MMFALGIEKSAGGQPWKWRRSGEPGLTMDALIDELLLARGVSRDDLERHRKPTIRDFLPDPSCFQDMDKGAKRLADAVVACETIAISAIMTWTARPARPCSSSCYAGWAQSRWSTSRTD